MYIFIYISYFIFICLFFIQVRKYFYYIWQNKIEYLINLKALVFRKSDRIILLKKHSSIF